MATAFKKNYEWTAKSKTTSDELQVVYVDFDGERTSYNGELIAIDNVEVQNSGFSDSEISAIIARLNENTDDNIIFTAHRPAGSDVLEYSTVYVGKTNAFSQYGEFAGLAETIDKGNKNKSDKAFVMLDASDSADDVVSIINHEVGHIINGEEHLSVNGDLSDYAATYWKTGTSTNVGTLTDYNNTFKLSLWDGFSCEFIFTAGYTATISLSISGSSGAGGLYSYSGTKLASYGSYYTVTAGNTYSIYTYKRYDTDIQTQYTVTMTAYSVSGSGSSSSGSSKDDLGSYTPSGWDSSLVISSVSGTSTQSSTFTTNDNIYVDAAWDNYFNTTISKAYSVAVYVDNTLKKTYSRSGLSAGMYSSFTDLNIGKLKAGNHVIKVVLDSGKVLNDPDRKDNTITKTIYVNQALPNLFLTANSIPAEVLSNANVTIKAKAYNLGDASAGSSYVYVYAGSKKIGQIYTPAMNPGGYRDLKFTIKAGSLAPGNYKITLKADATNAVKESLESNTITVGSLKVVKAAANLVTSKFSMAASALDNEDISLSFYVSNSGNIKANSSYAYIYDGNKKIGQVATPAIAAGGSKKLTAKIAKGKLSAGVHNITIKADGSNIIKESNESNSLSKKIKIIKTAANLATSKFSMAESALDNENISLSFYISNSGNIKANSSYAYIYDGNKKIGQVATPAIAAGGSKKLTATIAKGKLSAGVHNITIKADGSNIIKESNENNSISKKIKIIKTAVNLAPSKFSMATSALDNENISLSFYVSNSGNTKANSSYAYIYDGNKKIGQVATPAIAAGSSKKLTATIAAGKLSVGVHNIIIKADGSNIIKESNESNSLSKKIKIIKASPNLAPSKFSMATSALDNENISLSFYISNSGNTKANSSYVYIYDGNKKIGQVATPAIAAGSSKKLTATIAAGKLSAGTHNITLKADGSNVVKESNENNSISKKISITKTYVNLAISGLQIASETTTDETIWIKFNVCNGGKKTAPASAVNIYAGSRLLKTVSVGSIAGGGQIAMNVAIAAGTLSAGQYKINVVADAKKAIVESNENNTVSQVISIVKPARMISSPLLTKMSRGMPADDGSLSVNSGDALDLNAWQDTPLATDSTNPAADNNQHTLLSSATLSFDGTLNNAVASDGSELDDHTVNDQLRQLA